MRLHGDLANKRDGFVAFEELLATGATNKLPKTPASVGTAEVKGVRSGAEPVLFQTEEALLRNALGPLAKETTAALESSAGSERRDSSRRFAARALAACGWTLPRRLKSSTRSTLDEQFEGRLFAPCRAGALSGRAGHGRIVLAPECRPPGALTLGWVRSARSAWKKYGALIRDAALRYARHLVETPADEKVVGSSSPKRLA
jgi:hypothetical protein